MLREIKATAYISFEALQQKREISLLLLYR